MRLGNNIKSRVLKLCSLLTICSMYAFTASAQQPVSNFRIMVSPYIFNPVTGFPWQPPYLHMEDILPELTQPEDMLLFNLDMSDFGGYNLLTNGYLPDYYGKFFFDGPSDIGIDTGIVLNTGRTLYIGDPYSIDTPGVHCGLSFPAAYNSTGPNPGNTMGEPSSGDGTPWGPHRFSQYADLSALNNGDSIRDANVLDFDFVPKSSHIRLQYVFASEEYPENACASANDVMGIFLSKPGIPGYQNIALLPGTNTAVGLQSVFPPNSACHPETPGGSPYYVDNTNGQNVIFDGFSTVLTAMAEVTPCDTYHLRIAVADGAWHTGACDTLEGYPDAGTDSHCMGLYDSGIFLKQHSFRSTDELRVKAYGGIASDTTAPYAVRGCLNGGFRLQRGRPDPFPLTLYYTLSGTAIPGQDYSPLSGSATIPANDTVVDIAVSALTTGSGAKTLKLVLHSPYSTCTAMGPADMDSAVLHIYDQLYANIPQTDTTICTGCSTRIAVDGDPALQYAWTPATGLDDANAQNPVAMPPQTTQYFMTATAPAPVNCPAAMDSVYIYVGNVGIAELQANQGISIAPNPFRESFQLKVDKVNKEARYKLLLSDPLGKAVLSLEGTIETLNRQLAKATALLRPGIYFLDVSDMEGKSRSTLKAVKIK